MEITQKQRVKAFRDVLGFLATNREKLGDVLACNAKATLEEVVEAIKVLAAEQDPTRFRRNQMRGAQERSRKRIKTRWIRPIARVARTELAESPEYRKMRHPPSGIDSEGFVTAVREMRTAAAGAREVFVRAGLPSNFEELFEQDIEDLVKTMDERRAGRGVRSGATRKLAKEISRGVGAVSVLEALVLPLIEGEPDLVAQWTNCKAGDYRPGARSPQTTSEESLSAAIVAERAGAAEAETKVELERAA